MAKYHDGYMGAFNGKLGPAVAYNWKGRHCLRAYQPMPRDPKSEKQLRCRVVFGIASRLASAMQDAIEIGLKSVADYRRTSEHNIFVSLNRHCVSVEDEVISVDYAGLQMAVGDLPPVEFGTPQVDSQRTVSVEYSMIEDIECCCHDYVYLYAYLPSLDYGLLSLPSARNDGRVSLELPRLCSGREAHLYGFVWDHSDEASPSEYLGNITIS